MLLLPHLPASRKERTFPSPPTSLLLPTSALEGTNCERSVGSMPLLTQPRHLSQVLFMFPAHTTLSHVRVPHSCRPACLECPFLLATAADPLSLSPGAASSWGPGIPHTEWGFSLDPHCRTAPKQCFTPASQQALRCPLISMWTMADA